jgi:hypothetical protein
MQKCWHNKCEFDGMTDFYYPFYDRTYPVCYKHYIADSSLIKVSA